MNRIDPDYFLGGQLRLDRQRAWDAIARHSIIQVFTRACPCGMPGKRRKILGRVDDMLIVKGINVYPAAVKNLIGAFVPRVTGEIRIVLRERPPRVAPPLEIKVERGDSVDGNDLAQLAADLTQKIQDVLSFTPRLEFVQRGRLERSSLKGKLIEKAYP
ncbi:MAG: hypothetical protein HY661_14745 [Betaproteobacteria bacterium]|nr:hypothetical protein [Betaproteobacteria bacterium]